MPIEIKELIIRAIVVEPQTTNAISSRPQDDITERSMLIQECVHEVLKRLDKMKER